MAEKVFSYDHYNPYLRDKRTKSGDKYTGAWYIEENQLWFFIQDPNRDDGYLYETREEPADYEWIFKLGKAYEAGAAAFKAGKLRVPALDPNTMNDLLKGMAVGTGAAKVLDAWLYGWDYENLFSDFVPADEHAHRPGNGR